MTDERKSSTLELLQTYQQQPSPRLRNRLVELNLGLVRKEAHHWRQQTQENFDDLLQVGCIGLIQAIERFDLTRGIAFSTFAIPYIRGEIQHYLRDRSSTLRIPRRWTELVQRSKKVGAQLRQDLGRLPTDQEMCEVLGISVLEWQELLMARQNQATLSLDAPVKEEASTLGDLLPDSRYQSFQLAQEDQIRLRQAMAKLEDRTREILEFVFLYDLTQKETAERLNISAVTVSRKLKKGLQQLYTLLNREIF